VGTLQRRRSWHPSTLSSPGMVPVKVEHVSSNRASAGTDMPQAVVTGRRHFLSVLDFEAGDLERCLALAAELKRDRPLRRKAPTAAALDGHHVALLFEKPSLRTRSTFEVAVQELGGQLISLQPDVALGWREPVIDVARNLERWVDAVVIRTFSQELLQEFAGAVETLHVINALTDQQHPCQAVADLLTLQERWGSVRGRTIAYIGDGNNVAASLSHAAAMLGAHLHIASPEGYELPQDVVRQSASVARFDASLRLFARAADAVAGADAVYTDVWTSMGQEAEANDRREQFAEYQVNARLMALAAPEALFMHCPPARRGEEVPPEVIESRASVVFDQAENRLHGQKALLLMLLGRP
jgi:ornithine carbamoyltransferase